MVPHHVVAVAAERGDFRGTPRFAAHLKSLCRVIDSANDARAHLGPTSGFASTVGNWKIHKETYARQVHWLVLEHMTINVHTQQGDHEQKSYRHGIIVFALSTVMTTDAEASHIRTTG